MISTAILFMITYGLFAGLLVVGTYLSESKERSVKWKEKERSNTILLDQLSVLIPFRNEATRLEPLLQSINQSSELPQHIYFIDDGSTDGGSESIRQQLTITNYSILMGNGDGKKSALRTGIHAVQTNYLLTLDADICFKSNFFKELETLPDSDLLILPVRMKGSGLRRLYELDVHLANALNVAAAGILDPIMASGANLLVRKDAFLAHDRWDTHSHLASGDDQFLLRDFKEARARILVCTDPVHQVTTDVPISLSELLHQRVRWFSKTNEVGDTTANVLAAIQLVFTLSFVVLLFFSLLRADYPLAIALLFLKTLVDIFAFGPYFQRIGRASSLLLLPFYELLFPLYGALILFLSLIWRPSWKGRPVRVKKKGTHS